MQEKSNGHIGNPLADEFGQQHEVIVLNPYRIAGFEQVFQLIAKSLVHRAILGPFFGAVRGVEGKIMEDQRELNSGLNT